MNDETYLEQLGWLITSRYWAKLSGWTGTAVSKNGWIHATFHAPTREEARRKACDWALETQRTVDRELGPDTERPPAMENHNGD